MIERFIHKHFDFMVRICAVWVVLCALIAAASTFAPTTPAKAEEQEQAATEAETVKLYDVPLDAELQVFIIEQAEAHDIEPAVIFAMIDRESSFNTAAVGDNCNSFGLMQIQTRWHHERMERLECTDLFDPFQNVTVGIDYLDELLHRYDGDMSKALTAYNKGSFSGTVTEYALAVMESAAGMKSHG